eukprot:4372661-Ditylum_brightwellii.AAC.2
MLPSEKLCCKVMLQPNPPYASKVLMLFLAVAPNRSKKTFEFVSGKLGKVTLWHFWRLFTSQHKPPFININSKEAVDKLSEHLSWIQDSLDKDDKQVAFSVGVDAT